jgi:hypothetical protein
VERYIWPRGYSPIVPLTLKPYPSYNPAVRLG